MMFFRVCLGGDFLWLKKGQTFNTYSEELKREVVCLKWEEDSSYRQLHD
jgi:transposase